VERRKAWRLIQSKAGIENKEYKAQRSILADMDAGKISKEELVARAEELMKERLGGPVAAAGEHKPTTVVAKPAQAPSVQNPPERKHGEAAKLSAGADDVINIGICAVCEQTLTLAYPDAVDAGGQIVHATCACKTADRTAN
jgi:hypothetical protein